jgi:predicted solute-binding protein
MVFSTRPAAKKVGIQDRFEVRYSIQNANVQRFSLPTLTDFDVVGGPMQSQSTSYVNGERSSSIELTYIFKAKHKGTLVIPGGIAMMDGKQYRSNDVSIEVIDGSVAQQNNQGRNRGYNPFDDDPFGDQSPFGGNDPFAAMQQQQMQMMKQLRQLQQQAFGGAQPMIPQSAPGGRSAEPVNKEDIDKNIFIKVDVDKRNVALGEQITAVYKLYTRLPMQVNLTKLPSLIGFWSQDFKIPQPPKPSREVLDGKEYQVFVLKKSALFPTQTGTLTLDPAQAEGAVKVLSSRKVKHHDPFEEFFGGSLADAFVTAYGYEDVPVKLKSTPISIQVSDIPKEKKPASFQGAVGHYSLESNIDKTELTTDDNATITLRISGSGNLKLIGTPALSIPEDIDTYDPVVRDTITNTNNIIAGYKTFSYTLSPRVAGIFTIPAAEFSYYEPSSNSYKTLIIPSYTLHVKPGKNAGMASRNILPKDIHDIQGKVSALQQDHSGRLPSSGLFWSGFALPLLAYIGLLAFRKREEKLQSDVVLFKNKRANKVALKRLALAEKYLAQSAQNPFYEETSKAVWLYLSDKLNIPLSSLSKEVAEEKLSARMIPIHIKSEIFRITGECEMALYSPDSGTLKMKQTYSDTLRLIGKLEEILS